jgi:murein DD-endopeptidase MepM/ murein hydrolase activator NlpD
MRLGALSITRILIVVALLCAGALAWFAPRTPVRDAVAYVMAPSPHARYAAWLGLRGIAATPAGEAWRAAADAALSAPRAARAPFADTGVVDAAMPSAVAWRLDARRGQRVIANLEFDSDRVFVDLFDDGDRRASAAPGERQLVYDVEANGPLVIRVQPELGVGGAFRIVERSAASMIFPVQGLSPRAVQSRFGASRDEGRRKHEGVDIFAKKGTPVLAATDGWIGGSAANTLGGTVVWVWSPLRRVSTYYAHLDRRAVSSGQRVKAGEVIGYVGNTGNARGGPFHLHFGVYAAGEGSIDPLPFICDAPCGMR